ncbi:MAG: hypothetical protein ABII98_01615 [bacterium]
MKLSSKPQTPNFAKRRYGPGKTGAPIGVHKMRNYGHVLITCPQHGHIILKGGNSMKLFPEFEDCKDLMTFGEYMEGKTLEELLIILDRALIIYNNEIAHKGE